jgi:hypothetical protein
MVCYRSFEYNIVFTANLEDVECEAKPHAVIMQPFYVIYTVVYLYQMFVIYIYV